MAKFLSAAGTAIAWLLIFHSAHAEEIQIDVRGQSQIQEFAVIVSNLDIILPAFTNVLKWDIKHQGPADKTVALSWGLPAETNIQEVLVGNKQSNYGFVRLIEIEDTQQSLIRPGASWWDLGGILNINVLVKNSAAIIAGLRELGWTTRALPENYNWPGNLKGVSMIMIGPDDLMLSFQERQSPPLKGWPEFASASHIEVGYERANNPEAWTEFYQSVVGFKVRDLSTRGDEKDTDIGPNDFGLPHNSRNAHYSILGGAKPHDGEQLIGVRHFPNATGYDFSDRARPPNIGIAAVRFPVENLDALSSRIRANDIEFAATPQIVNLHPYGKVKLLAVRTPGGGNQWVEFFEPGTQPMSKEAFSKFLEEDRIGQWSGVGGASGEIFFNTDGTAKVTFDRGEAVGTWALKGNAICTSWTTLRNGRESCAVYYHLYDNDYQSFQMNGAVEGFTRFQ